MDGGEEATLPSPRPRRAAGGRAGAAGVKGCGIRMLQLGVAGRKYPTHPGFLVSLVETSWQPGGQGAPVVAVHRWGQPSRAQRRV